MNYEELITSLHNCIECLCGECKYKYLREHGNFVKCMGKLTEDAANAIEELQKTVKVYQQFLIFVGAEFLFVPKKEAELQAERHAEDVNRKQTEMIKAYLPRRANDG